MESLPDQERSSRTTPHDGFAYIDRAGVKAVFCAASSTKAELSIRGDADRHEAILRAGKSLLGMMIFASEEQQRMARKDARAIAEAFERLSELITKVPPLCRGAPPPMPGHWQDTMSEWAEIYAGAGEPGRDIDWFADFFYPKIFGLFVASFGREPGQTHNGPAVRFATSLFNAARGARLQIPPALDSNYQLMNERSAKRLREPHVDSILKRIVSTRPDVVWAEELVERHMNQLTTYDPWPSAE